MSRIKPYKSILLVDDDLVSNFLTKRVIQNLKIADHTFLARNGEEALSCIENKCRVCGTVDCPDLILLDLKMPVMNGFDFLEELQVIKARENRSFKVIVVSSSENPRDRENLASYPVDGYIPKPLTAEKLKELVLV